MKQNDERPAELAGAIGSAPPITIDETWCGESDCPHFVLGDGPTSTLRAKCKLKNEDLPYYDGWLAVCQIPEPCPKS